MYPEAGGGDLLQQYEKGTSSLLLLADLMGHGLGAKGYAYALAGYLRGLCSSLSLKKGDLSKLLQQLSSGFNSDLVLQETLATIMAIQIKPDGSVQIVNAGQPHPLLLIKSSCREVQANGPLLGLSLVGEGDYVPQTFKMDTGNRLLLFSDGFKDAADAWPTVLMDAIQESHRLPLSAAADYILQQRLGLGGAIDDLTLVLLERGA